MTDFKKICNQRKIRVIGKDPEASFIVWFLQCDFDEIVDLILEKHCSVLDDNFCQDLKEIHRGWETINELKRIR